MGELNIRYDLWMHLLPKIGNARKQKISKFFGSAENLYKASEKELINSKLFIIEEIGAILENRQEFNFEKWENLLKNKSVDFLSVEEEKYPKRLREIYDCPYGIFYRGTLPEDDLKTAAIVGARRCSAYGKAAAEEMVYELTNAGFVIVSGMARGIDGIAHRKSIISGGKTIAVLGSGVDVCYPKENRDLFEDIPGNGCVLSEYEPGTEALAQFFPQRNRIISALSDITIVVEAREKSGSLITADFALEQGKDVYAIPGRMFDPMSAGCNKLIAEGAGIIRNPKQFIMDINELNSVGMNNTDEDDSQKLILEKEETLVYSCLDFYAKSVEQIYRETNLTLIQILSALNRLVELGLAKECFTNQYTKIH